MTFLGIVFVTSKLAVGAGDGVGLWEATTPSLNLWGLGCIPEMARGQLSPASGLPAAVAGGMP